MTDLRQHIAYLEGLAEGLRLDRESEQGKLFRGMVQALRALSEGLEDLDDRVEALEACVWLDEDEEEVGEEAAELVCPSCGYAFFLEDETGDDELDLTCPQCGQPVGPEEDEARPRARAET